MKVEEIIYKIPLDKSEINKIPSLENFNYTNGYCKVTPLKGLSTLNNLHLISVYDFFTNSVEENVELDLLNGQALLFGRVLSEKISSRGKDKFIKLNSITSNIEIKDLPYLRYNSSQSAKPESNWFYIEPAEYYIFSAKKTELVNVKHLETLSVYSEGIIRLRIIVELLKGNISKGLLSLGKEDFVRIGCSYLKTNNTFKNIDDITIRSGVERWIDEMLFTTRYSEISIKNKEIPAV